MPHLTSNIPSNMFYYGLGAEIHRTACTISKCERFCKTCENLIYRMSKEGGEIIFLQCH